MFWVWYHPCVFRFAGFHRAGQHSVEQHASGNGLTAVMREDEMRLLGAYMDIFFNLETELSILRTRWPGPGFIWRKFHYILASKTE